MDKLPPQGVIPTPYNPFDWVVGGMENNKVEYEVRNATGDWRPYLPTGESQWRPSQETSSCTNQAAINSLETQVFFLTGDRVNYSECWNAKQAGTDPNNGNYVEAAHEVVRLQGTPLQSEWDLPSNWTLQDFYRPVTQESRQKARLWLDKYEYSHAWVTISDKNLKDWLKTSPICITVSTCDDWNNSNVGVCNKNTQNHAVLLTHIDEQGYHIHDSYNPYNKILAKGNKIYSAKIGIVKIKQKQDIVPQVYQMGQERGVILRAATPEGYKQILEQYKKQDNPEITIKIV